MIRHCYHIGKFFSTSVSTNLLKRRWKCGSICSTIRTAMRESWEVYKMPQAEVMKKKNCLEFIGRILGGFSFFIGERKQLCCKKLAKTPKDKKN